jgi:hypothetical protein
MQWPVNNVQQLVSMAIDMDTTRKEELETVFPIGSAPGQYSKHKLDNLLS